MCNYNYKEVNLLVLGDLIEKDFKKDFINIDNIYCICCNCEFACICFFGLGSIFGFYFSMGCCYWCNDTFYLVYYLDMEYW